MTYSTYMAENFPRLLNGCNFKDLEYVDQAYVRSLMRRNQARIVQGKVQIRNVSDVGYTQPYTVPGT